MNRITNKIALWAIYCPLYLIAYIYKQIIDASVYLCNELPNVHTSLILHLWPSITWCNVLPTVEAESKMQNKMKKVKEYLFLPLMLLV